MNFLSPLTTDFSCVSSEGLRLLGAAYGRAEKRVQELVTKLRVPFLPTPMAKGMLPDEHFLSVGSARSR